MWPHPAGQGAGVQLLGVAHQHGSRRRVADPVGAVLFAFAAAPPRGGGHAFLLFSAIMSASDGLPCRLGTAQGRRRCSPLQRGSRTSGCCGPPSPRDGSTLRNTCHVPACAAAKKSPAGGRPHDAALPQLCVAQAPSWAFAGRLRAARLLLRRHVRNSAQQPHAARSLQGPGCQLTDNREAPCLHGRQGKGSGLSHLASR